MKKLLLGAVLTLSLVFTGCTGGGSGSGYSISSSTVSSFVSMLEANYGGNFSVVKGPYDSASEGFVVVYDNWAGDYLAFDILNYTPGMGLNTYLNSAEYEPTLIHDSYVDGWGEVMYVGYTYYTYGGYAGEFVFEEVEVAGKDLEKLGAFKEQANIASISEALVGEYNFSEERATEVAKMAIGWKKLSGTRTMTEGDTAKFTKNLIGKELADAQNLLKKIGEGDTEAYESFVNAAAEFNGNSPEDIKDFVNTHMFSM